MNDLEQNKADRQQIIEKWEGKTVRDKKHNETFDFDPQRDWFVLSHEPERFEEFKPIRV